MLVEKYEIRQDSAGAGQYRGGLGAEMVVQALSPFTVTTRIDRVHCKPWGLEGGGDAMGNGLAVRHKGEWKTRLRPRLPRRPTETCRCAARRPWRSGRWRGWSARCARSQRCMVGYRAG